MFVVYCTFGFFKNHKYAFVNCVIFKTSFVSPVWPYPAIAGLGHDCFMYTVLMGIDMAENKRWALKGWTRKLLNTSELESPCPDRIST